MQTPRQPGVIWTTVEQLAATVSSGTCRLELPAVPSSKSSSTPLVSGLPGEVDRARNQEP